MRLPILTAALLLLIAPAAIAAPPDAEALARRLLNSQGCKACHRIEGAGATSGPDLEKAGSRLSAEQIRARLVNPQQQHAGGRIKDFSHLQAEELDALALFLSGRK